MNDDQLAKVMRAIYAVMVPDFEDVGQPISQMRWVAQHRKIPLEEMARAAMTAIVDDKGSER